MIRAIGVVVGALVFAACVSGGAPISGQARNVGAVTMTLRIEPKRLKAGQTVRLHLNLVNNSGRPTTLKFASGQRYDFWVTRSGREVWRWSADRAFIQAEQIDELAGQSSQQYAESWQADEPGRYIAHAKLLAEGYAGDLEGEVIVQ